MMRDLNLVPLAAVAAVAGCGQAQPLTRLTATLDAVGNIAFGEISVGRSRTELLTIGNTGNDTLVIEDVRLLGDDAFGFETKGGTSVAAEQTALWEVTFAPLTEGDLDATLLVQSNHARGQLVEILLVGTGVRGCIDNDDDGYGTGCLSGPDCDDDDPDVNERSTWYRDADGDDFGDPQQSQPSCTQPADYVSNSLDCDDTNAELNVSRAWYQDADSDSYGNPEVSAEACAAPDGYVDNALDCDDLDAGRTPETVWYRDFDGDLYGDPAVFQNACVQPVNYVDNALDCDDTDYTRHPDAVWYRDADGDTFGTPYATAVGCAPPPGYVGNDSDCDDTNADRHPGAVWYRDEDGDTYGNPNLTTVACQPAAGWVGNPDDCDDTNAAIVPTVTWYRDADSDSYGDVDVPRMACSQPTGYVANADDCDDDDVAAHPGAVWYRDFDGDSFGNPAISKVDCPRTAGWVENNLDCDDTNGAIGASISWYRDADGDTYGTPAVTQHTCARPSGYVENDLDCDDDNAAVHPGAVESDTTSCTDGLDNDCDGEPDSFDSACTHVDCGAPAHYLATDVCNPDYPANLGPQICEEYPNSQWPEGQREQCMHVCRTSSECPAGQACYPSRRSLNLHFCAPALGATLIAEGGVCTADAQCETALCHAGICRDSCVRNADCDAGMVCRAEVRTHAYIGNEISTGVCEPQNPALLPVGSNCTARAQCQSGVCAQSMQNGPYLCRRSCGSEGDCPFNERCAGALYNADPTVGYGYRACSEAPTTGWAGVGQSCYSDLLGGWYAAGCRSFFCDATYCPNNNPYDATNCPIEPYCGGLCDRDEDCPLLFPGGPFNLRMRCLISSSSSIQPLIGGYCAPYFCETTADCEPGRTCFIFNGAPKEWTWLASGICQ